MSKEVHCLILLVCLQIKGARHSVSYLNLFIFSGSVYQPVISDRDNTEIFLIHYATVTMYNASDGDGEGIYIDDATGQQLRAMGISVDGRCTIIVTCVSVYRYDALMQLLLQEPQPVLD